MTTPNRHNWKRIVGQRIRHLTPEQARAALDAIQRDGITIQHATVRTLTNGINSQSINAYVIRKLAVRAGYINADFGV